jgi:hypothetical protein
MHGRLGNVRFWLDRQDDLRVLLLDGPLHCVTIYHRFLRYYRTAFEMRLKSRSVSPSVQNTD